MTNTEKVRSLIAGKGLKMQFVAKMLGLSAYGFKLKLENKNEFKSSEISALCTILGVRSLEQKEELFFANSVDYKSTNEMAQK